MDASEVQLTIECVPIGSKGIARLTAMLGDQILHTDKGDVGTSMFRERFAMALCQGGNGINKEEVLQKLQETGVSVAQRGKSVTRKPSPSNIKNLIRV